MDILREFLEECATSLMLCLFLPRIFRFYLSSH
uniref:Uncharacterized protein n=1 Tax=Arundo donax TaxID=35708 RepID=A0A0A9FYA3_ARUDO